MEVKWPNGRSETLAGTGVNQALTIVEGKRGATVSASKKDDLL
jgi:hypothetical protein